MSGGSTGSPDPRGGGDANWTVLRDLVILAAVGILSYVALALLDPRSLVRAVAAALGPASPRALLASLLVVAFAVAFLTWRRSLELLRDVEEQADTRERMEQLAEVPRHEPHPVLVVDLEEESVTFLNEAADEAFADLPEAGLEHPVFRPLREQLAGGLDVDRERSLEATLDLEEGVFEAKARFDTGEGVAHLHLHDVTQHRELQEDLRESQEKLRQVTDHIGEFFWMTDLEKEETLYVSPAYEDIWGRSQQSLYDEPGSWLEAVHPEDRDRVEAALPRQAEGEYDEEYRIVRPDGEVRWIRDRAYPVEDDEGEVERLVGVAEDVTRERVAFDRLTDALRREKLLVDVIGHDVSNLLTRAIPRLDLLERKHPELDEEVERVRAPVERATEVLEQAILLLRLEMDEIESGDRQRLGVLVRDVVEGMEHVAEEEGVAIRTSNHLPVDPLVDPLVGRALENVLRNAVEHSPEGQDVEVRIRERDDGGARLAVVDHGPGFPEDLREQLFERFEPRDRGSASEEDRPGLGLPISHRIMDRVGGSLRLEETPGGGATVALELPPPEGAQGQAADGTRRRAVDAP